MEVVHGFSKDQLTDGPCLILIGTALAKANAELVREQAVFAAAEFAKQA